jgi:hypothetical protein
MHTRARTHAHKGPSDNKFMHAFCVFYLHLQKTSTHLVVCHSTTIFIFPAISATDHNGTSFSIPCWQQSMSCVTAGYGLQFLKICELQHFAPALATDHIRPVMNSHDTITTCVRSSVTNYMLCKRHFLTNPFIYLFTHSVSSAQNTKPPGQVVTWWVHQSFENHLCPRHLRSEWPWCPSVS